MNVFVTIAVSIFALLDAGRAANEPAFQRCQKWFVEDVRANEADFAPWALLPDAAVSYDTLKVAVRIDLAPGSAVPFERLGLNRDARVVPPAPIHSRDGRVFALLTGSKFAVLAAAEDLRATYGADRLFFQIKAEPDAQNYAHLPMPDFSKPMTNLLAPLERDAVLTDLATGRFAVALTNAVVPPRAARVLNIAWLDSAEDAVAALRRDESFVQRVVGGVVVSGAAFARLARLTPRPLTPALDALIEMPEATGAWEIDLVADQVRNEVDPTSAWAINAVVREWAHGHGMPDSVRLDDALLHLWHTLAPHETPANIWREILRANFGALAIADVEGSNENHARALKVLWGKLRAAMRNYVHGRSPRFDANTHEPNRMDALDIALTLRGRYPSIRSSLPQVFEALWNDRLKTSAPSLAVFEPDAMAKVLYRTDAAADAAVIVAYAQFLSARSNEPTPMAQPTVEEAPSAAVAPEPSVEPATEIVPVAETAEPATTSELVLTPESVLEKLAEVTPEKPTVVAPAAPASARAVTSKSEGPKLDWPLSNDFDVDAIDIKDMLLALQARFKIPISRAGAAEAYLTALFAADVGEPAPELRLGNKTASNAFYINGKAASEDIRKIVRTYIAAMSAKRAAAAARKAAAAQPAPFDPAQPDFATIRREDVTVRDVIDILRAKHTVAMSRPNAAQELFNQIYRAELKTAAPSFKFDPQALSKAYYSGGKVSTKEIMDAFFDRFIPAWRKKHSTAVPVVEAETAVVVESAKESLTAAAIPKAVEPVPTEKTEGSEGEAKPTETAPVTPKPDVEPTKDIPAESTPAAADAIENVPEATVSVAPESDVATAEAPPAAEPEDTAPSPATAPTFKMIGGLPDPEAIVDEASVRALLQILKDDEVTNFKYPDVITRLFERLFERLPTEFKPKNVRKYVSRFGLARYELQRLKRASGKPAENIQNIYREYHALHLRARQPRSADVWRVKTMIATLATRLNVPAPEVSRRGDVFASLMAMDGGGRKLDGEMTPEEFDQAVNDPRSAAATKLTELFNAYDEIARARVADRVAKLTTLAKFRSHWTTYIARGLRKNYPQLDTLSVFRKIWRDLLPSVPSADVEAIFATHGLEADDLEAALNYPVPPAVHRRLRAVWAALLDHAREVTKVASRELVLPKPDASDFHLFLLQLRELTKVSDLNASGGILTMFHTLFTYLDPSHAEHYRALIADSGIQPNEHERLRDDPQPSQQRIMKLYRTIYARLTGEDVGAVEEVTFGLPNETASLKRDVRAQIQRTIEKLHPNLALSATRGHGRIFDAILKQLQHRPNYDQARQAFDEIAWKDDDYLLIDRDQSDALARVRRAWRILQLLVEPKYVRDEITLDSVKRTAKTLQNAMKAPKPASAANG